MNSIGRPHYAVFAGLSGSAASVFGKFISQSEELIGNYSNLSDQQVLNEFLNKTFSKDFLNRFSSDFHLLISQEYLWNWLLKCSFIGLMVLCNVLVWVFFVKSLQEPGGSVVATVTSTATNYCCSVIIFLSNFTHFNDFN